MHRDSVAREAREAAEQQAMARKLAKAQSTRPFHLINQLLLGRTRPAIKRAPPFKRTPSLKQTQPLKRTPHLKRSLVGFYENKGMLSSTSPQSRFPCSQPSARFLP